MTNPTQRVIEAARRVLSWGLSTVSDVPGSSCLAILRGALLNLDATPSPPGASCPDTPAWTREVPTVAGHYFRRHISPSGAMYFNGIFHVGEGHGYDLQLSGERQLDDGWYREWSGPIPLPPEPEEG